MEPVNINALPDALLFMVLHQTDFRTRMSAQCVCRRWRGLPERYPELLGEGVSFTITRPNSIIDQQALDDMATWLLSRGQHVRDLTLLSYPPEREEGTMASWRESQLWLTATACLGACAGRLEELKLRWHDSLDLTHHFLMLRHLTGLTAVSDHGIMPQMLMAHTNLRSLSLDAFTLCQSTPPDEFLPPRLTRLHLAVDLDRVPTQLLRLTELRALSLHSMDPHARFPATLNNSLSLLGRLTQLSELDLSESNLLELPPGLSALTNLTYLGLGSTHWRQGDLDAVLQPMTALQALDLSDQELPSLPAPVVALTGLCALSIAGQLLPLVAGPYCASLEHLEVDLAWLSSEGESLRRLPRLRSLTLANFGRAGDTEDSSLLRRRLADLLEAAPRLMRLVLAVGEESGTLPLAYAARVVEFARQRPQVEVELCEQGDQPSPAETLGN